ncbi:NAD(P)-binding domain-containing protein [Streptomyces sp. N2-109]|uniref:NAD(P)-binding domain-containing protein n=1 Tax=Streptomyces gossypii TaxID=2883101 RepID=A0ABT2JXD9_9ACTN|nr:NAD(P)-binding domain-containing protein [Streptomyces gossypii]MCT2592516.1 NAD(P)-binding domain-containing protein [Streptomyces gossypii]
MSKQAVTVIGLGPMGSAMVRAYLAQGHPVTVWNRTASRADELVAEGAVRAASAGAAVAANELVVLSLTDYEAMYAILEPVSDSLSGRVIVNLTSDTPEKARAAAKWAARHGAEHLTGGVLTPPSGIGNPEFSTLYSGPRKTFEAHRDTLEVLTATDYRGEDAGLAALYYQLNMDVFRTSMLACLHAFTVAEAHGIKATDLLPYVKNAAALDQFLDFYAPRLDAGEHPGDVDRLAMGVASVDHIVHTTKDAGIDAALPEAVLEIFRRGVAAGHGADSFTSLAGTLRGARK